jgi:hypothetical protein
MGRCAMPRAPRPIPLHHQATKAQINLGLYPPLDEKRGSGQLALNYQTFLVLTVFSGSKDQQRYNAFLCCYERQVGPWMQDLRSRPYATPEIWKVVMVQLLPIYIGI